MRPLAWLALALSFPAAAADLGVRSRIDAVTVYRSSARVTRLAQVELATGDARILLEGLPRELDDDSIRVEGKGSAAARIFGVSVETVTRAQAGAPEVRAVEDRLEGLLEEDRALDDRVKQARARIQFVESLRSTYSEERAKNLAVRNVRSQEWAELVGFVGAEQARAASDVRKAEAAKRELARRIAAARADLEKLAAKRNESSKTVALEVSAEKAGRLELAVSYAVPSASWQPTWDARLLPETSTVELALLGSVRQRSGEDWVDARLAVSTAEPGRGLWVPQLESRWLQKSAPVPVMKAEAARQPAAGVMSLDAGRRAAKVASAAEEPEERPLEAPLAEATPGLLAATFTAPRRETVDGAGRARSVPLAKYRLGARVTRTAAPRVDPSAYLTAAVVNDTGVPLLPGLARVAVGDELVGRAPLAATPPGGELRLAFGADGRIEVERRVLDRRHESAGLLSKDEVFLYRIRTSVKNRYPTPATVRLLDLVPVSRDEAIRVRLLDGGTPATAEDPERPGVRTWELALGPREEKVVELRYEVRYPIGFPIQGLE
jgi:uncharacterized protein (TIGR02231 family)